MIYSYLILFALAFGIGYEASDIIYSAKEKKILEDYLAKENEYQRKIAELESKYLSEKEKKKVIYETVIKEVPKYITKIQKVDSDCNLSNGVVRLLNMSIDPSKVKNSLGNVTADSETSDVRESDLIEWARKSIRQYNEVADRCNFIINNIKSRED